MFARSYLGRWTLPLCGIAMLATLTGCFDKPTLLPISDPELNKESTRFAADAAKRTYPASAPRAAESLSAMGYVDHGFGNQIEVLNTSQQDWIDVEVWVNETYVVYLPTWKAGQMKKIDFKMLFDRDGQHFPTDNKTVQVKKIEALMGGKLYEVPSKLKD